MLLSVIAAIVLALVLLYLGRTWLGWVAPVAVLFLGWASSNDFTFTTPWLVSFAVFAVAAWVLGSKPVRRVVVSGPLLPLLTKILPRMSETERIALEAGTVWWDEKLFSGNPNWNELLEFRMQALSEKEREFLAGPCEELCGMLSDWEVTQKGDLPQEVWDFLKQKGFLGMIIPEKYGGLGFSAIAHSAVVTKLSSRSTTLAVTAMVPNSLGPAELILHYGTEEQKDRLLPRLARGDEIPAFALTEPNAGSDAGGMTSNGVICRGEFEGREVLGMRLNWNKRYITLVSVSTLLGLAFKLRDPDHLIGDEEDLGITCALIPTDLPGIEAGERHDPLGVPFHNGPTRGKDVFVPLDFIIGGKERAGQGWMMLMQSLAAGRGVSLPSMATGAAQYTTRVVGAYATIRQQFNTSIGKFEGIEERLARIGGLTYMMNAARILTAGAIDSGEKPSVVSAIVKAYLTESMRTVVNDGMDIVGGSGICRGPRNELANGYQALPIAITVEGANILTRSMIIFGQGAIRCHPFVQDEMKGAFEKDVPLFDRAFFGHIGFVFQNGARALVHALTGSRLASAPGGPMKRTYQHLTRMSASFALLADVAMGTLGGSLKRREKITGRLADALSWLYLASATLKRFHDEGSQNRDLPYVRWVSAYALYEIQQAIVGVLRNLPFRPAAWKLRWIVFPLGMRFSPPSDRLGHRVAAGLIDGNEPREHLSRDIFVPSFSEPGLGNLEDALDKVVHAQAVQKKIREAVKARKLEKKPREDIVARALAAGVITERERETLAEAEVARDEAVAVDAFGKQVHAELKA